VFYALGDGVTPFRWSLAGIGLNAIFCWMFVGGPTPWTAQLLPALYFGAAGLVLATVAVNLITSAGLLLALRRRLGGLPLLAWGRDTLQLLLAAVAAAVAAWLLASLVGWPTDLLGRLLQTGLSSGVGLVVYGAAAGAAGVPEAQQVMDLVRRRLPLPRRG
jgi:putative peptidoglycan lipid II flippase